MEIHALETSFRGQVRDYIREEWGGPLIVTLGNAYDSSALPGFAAAEGGKLLGAVMYRPESDGTALEVAALFSLCGHRGVGTALLDAVREAAKKQGCRRIWLVTTNDNTHAIRFYQRYGFALKAVHINSMEEVRRQKPGIPLTGIDGIPLAHEFEFELTL